MGVVGAVQTHAAQPVGQLPLTGSTHSMTVCPSLTAQQSWPALQQLPPQQNCAPTHIAPTRVQGGDPQVPFAQ
jgi:hypothetical protein